jgi:hypothetical protein
MISQILFTLIAGLDRLLPISMRDRGGCPSLQSGPRTHYDWEATMHSMTSAQAEQQLTDLADQFAHWRQDRTYRFAPIPLPLWEQAIALTAVFPRAYVAKRLRLRGSDRQKRCAARSEGSGVEPEQDSPWATPPALGFVEVPAASPWPLPAAPTESELQRAEGARLWICSHAPQLPLAALVRPFLETR